MIPTSSSTSTSSAPSLFSLRSYTIRTSTVLLFAILLLHVTLIPISHFSLKTSVSEVCVVAVRAIVTASHVAVAARPDITATFAVAALVESISDIIVCVLFGGATLGFVLALGLDLINTHILMQVVVVVRWSNQNLTWMSYVYQGTVAVAVCLFCFDSNTNRSSSGSSDMELSSWLGGLVGTSAVIRCFLLQNDLWPLWYHRHVHATNHNNNNNVLPFSAVIDIGINNNNNNN
eukprot:PhM_4_TR14026/c0_g1_i1/m.16100